MRLGAGIRLLMRQGGALTCQIGPASLHQPINRDATNVVQVPFRVNSGEFNVSTSVSMAAFVEVAFTISASISSCLPVVV